MPTTTVPPPTALQQRPGVSHDGADVYQIYWLRVATAANLNFDAGHAWYVHALPGASAAQ